MQYWLPKLRQTLFGVNMSTKLAITGLVNLFRVLGENCVEVQASQVINEAEFLMVVVAGKAEIRAFFSLTNFNDVFANNTDDR